MEFITFHVSVGDRDRVHPNKTMAHNEYLAMIAMMFGSARLYHPDARRVVLTDTTTGLGYALYHADAVQRTTIDGTRLMLERSRAQLRYVQANDFQQPMVILDSDILINQSLAPVFEHDFDVAVTWRMSDAQPINGGLLILNNLRPDVSRAFFERFVQTYEQQYAEQASWYGDQLALRDCVGLDQHELASRQLVDVDGCRILLLPCEIYNHSPDDQWAAISSDLLKPRVLHFKGTRKRLMVPFWRAWLRPRMTNDAIVHQRATEARIRLREALAQEKADSELHA